MPILKDMVTKCLDDFQTAESSAGAVKSMGSSYGQLCNINDWAEIDKEHAWYFIGGAQNPPGKLNPSKARFKDKTGGYLEGVKHDMILVEECIKKLPCHIWAGS